MTLQYWHYVVAYAFSVGPVIIVRQSMVPEA